MLVALFSEFCLEEISLAGILHHTEESAVEGVVVAFTAFIAREAYVHCVHLSQARHLVSHQWQRSDW